MVRACAWAKATTVSAQPEFASLLLLVGALLVAAALLRGCGSAAGERGVTGGGIGAGIGAGGAAITGGSPLGGAIIGGAVGGATGALTGEDDIDLGDPIWR